MARHRPVLRPEPFLCSDLFGVVLAVADAVSGAAHPVGKTFFSVAEGCAAHPVCARDHDACERFREPNLSPVSRNSPGRTVTPDPCRTAQTIVDR